MSTRTQVAAKVPAFTPARTGLLQRKCACGGSSGLIGECDECRKKATLQRRAANHAEPTAVPPIVHEVLRSPGQPLDATTRAFMEPRFGHDFSRVRVHSDAKAAESAQAVNALAYTVGQDIVFDNGAYAPIHAKGQRLLAHELAHVIQQTPLADSDNKRPLRVEPFGILEESADEAANHVMIEGVSSQRRVMANPPTHRIGRGVQCKKRTASTDEQLWAEDHPSMGFDFIGTPGLRFVFWNFDVGSSVIKPLHGEKLVIISPFLRSIVEEGSETDIEIQGYASPSGPESENRRVAQMRAAKVQLLLQNHFHIDETRFWVDSHGSQEPWFPNDTAEHKARNRRVEVSIRRRSPDQPEIKSEPKGTSWWNVGGSVDGHVATIYFKTDDDTLDRQSRDVLLEVGQAYLPLNRKETFRFNLTGFADRRGSESHNKNLSTQRARAVANYLLGKGFGEANNFNYTITPKVGTERPQRGHTSEQLNVHRRVDIFVVPPSMRPWLPEEPHSTPGGARPGSGEGRSGKSSSEESK